MTDLEHMYYYAVTGLCVGQDIETGVMEMDELDLPPEFCHYRDEGCELAGSCLNCPLPRCIYDQPRGRQQWLKRSRDEEIARRFTTEGKTIKELALELGISRRTVQRALKKTLVTEVPPDE